MRHNWCFAVAPTDALDAHAPLMLDAAERWLLFSVQVGHYLSMDRVFPHEGSRHIVNVLSAGVSLRDTCRSAAVHVHPASGRFASVLGIEVPMRGVFIESRGFGDAGAPRPDPRDGLGGIAPMGESRSGSDPSGDGVDTLLKVNPGE